MLLYECFCIGVSGPLIQYLKKFKKFSLGAELQPLRAGPTMSFPQACRFLEAGQDGGWGGGPEQLAAMGTMRIALVFYSSVNTPGAPAGDLELCI